MTRCIDMWVRAILLAGLILAPGVGAAYAGRDHMPNRAQDASAWHSSDFARVRLIRGGLDEEGRDLVAIIFEMEEGWHTYWREAGIMGLPPTFNWEGSSNFHDFEVHWPLPEYISFGSYETYGYYDRLVLPLSIEREDYRESAHLQLAIGYAVCEDVCIPTLGFLELSLPPGPAAMHAPYLFRHKIDDALSAVPTRDLQAAGYRFETPELEQGDDGKWALSLQVSSLVPFEDPFIIVEGPDGVRFDRAVYELDESGQILATWMPLVRDRHVEAFEDFDLRITVVGGQEPAEASLPVIMRRQDD